MQARVRAIRADPRVERQERTVSVVVWWAIPLLATVIAVAWLSWRARPRPGDPHDTVEERRRFNEAMQKHPGRRRRTPRPPAEPDPSTDHEESAS